MDALFSILDKFIRTMSVPMHIYSFRFSLWDLFIWTTIISILLRFVWGLFDA